MELNEREVGCPAEGPQDWDRVRKSCLSICVSGWCNILPKERQIPGNGNARALMHERRAVNLGIKNAKPE